MLDRIRAMISRAGRQFRDAESTIIRDSQDYWNNPDDSNLATNSHWRGNGPFQDDALWLSLGAHHHDLLTKAFTWAGAEMANSTVVEWGCGGGMNAHRIAPAVRQYIGVDISNDSLVECGRQTTLAGAANFRPVLVEAAEPENAVDEIGSDCDAFLSTYVFELLPTPEYGLRILAIAEKLLRAEGICLIQIRYNNGAADELSIGKNYGQNAAQMTTYLLDNFWTSGAKAGFEPMFLTLLPEQPELRERRYAYFAFRKPRGGC